MCLYKSQGLSIAVWGELLRNYSERSAAMSSYATGRQPPETKDEREGYAKWVHTSSLE